MLREMPTEPRRILVVRMGSIGDVARVLPMLAGLRERFPDAAIDWVVQRRVGDLLVGHRQIDRVFVVPFRRWWEVLSREGLELTRRMRARDYDLVLDFQGSMKGTFAGWLAGKRAVRVGWSPGHAEEGSWLLHHGHRSPPGRRVNRHLRFRCLVDWLDVPDLPGIPPPFGENDVAPVERFVSGIAGHPRPWVLVYPGTSPPGRHRRWKRERLAAATREIRDRTGGTMLVGWGPAEEELAREFAAGIEGAILIPPTTIRGLMALLERCDLFLGMNTGPMHLAALVGTPVLAVFGDRSDPRIHAPAEHLESRVIASPGARELRTWERRGLEPFEGPAPDEVAEAAVELLGKTRERTTGPP